MSETTPLPVPMIDLVRAHRPIEAELEEAFRRVLHSGRFILGDEVTGFEAEAAALLGSPHAIGVSSGTDALLAAMMALDLGPGDEVVCPSFTFFATGGCVSRLGAVPAFTDVSEASFNMEVEHVEAAVGPRTRAIVVVHLFGRHAELGTFSFFPTKNLSALGDAGLVVTGDDALAARVASLRMHGQGEEYIHHEIGGNFRIDALQAALLRVKLPHVLELNERRRLAAARYAEIFAGAGLAGEDGPVVVPDPGREGEHVFHQYVVRVPAERRDDLRAELAGDGIQTNVYYPLPLHRQACFAGGQAHDRALPVCERLSREVLALPMHPDLEPAEQERVVDAIRRRL
ncbi:MAG: DegT/DnrJ/EryC1/StrS family aminotransferase [Thermoanaerobaculia bacterium]|nr:DegT/DnrJ/EryC1/StrS family aminotransferase [Thermoanaerobaculia bacterium]